MPQQGDSGFLLVRDRRPFFKSPVLQHHFVRAPLDLASCMRSTESGKFSVGVLDFYLAWHYRCVLCFGLKVGAAAVRVPV